MRTEGIMASKDSHPQYRSAGNGRFAKENQAKRDPSRYVKEQVPNPGKGDTGRGSDKGPKKK